MASPGGTDRPPSPASVEPTPSSTAPGGGRGRLLFRLTVLTVVVLAGLLRALPLFAALPYTSYVDEGWTLHPAAHIVVGRDPLPQRTWTKQYYQYPSLVPELTAGVVKAWSLADPTITTRLRTTDRADDGAGVYDGASAINRNYDLLEPSQLILSGRLVVWLASVGIVALTIVLARVLVGRRGAFLAGALVAAMPALVSRSAITLVDTPATFFVMASIAAAAFASRGRRTLGFAILAGAAAGLAFTSKYPAVACLAVLGVVILWRRDLSWPARLGRLAAAAATAAVVAVVAMPDLILKTGDVRRGISRVSQIYAGKSGASFLTQTLTPSQLGTTMFVVALLGIVVLVISPRSRSVTVGWIGFALVLVGSYSRYGFQPLRDLLPLFPFLAVAAAAAVLEALRWVGQRLGLLRVTRDVMAGLLTLALVLLMVGGGVVPYLQQHVNVVDSRTTVVEWLETHTHPGQRVLVAEELGVLPSELARIPAQVEVAYATGDQSSSVDLSHVDYVVTGAYPEGTSAWPAALARSSAHPVDGAGAGPSTTKGWRGNGEGIDIFAVP